MNRNLIYLFIYLKKKKKNLPFPFRWLCFFPLGLVWLLLYILRIHLKKKSLKKPIKYRSWQWFGDWCLCVHYNSKYIFSSKFTLCTPTYIFLNMITWIFLSNCMGVRACVCTRQVVLLTWWAVFRDSLYYILSVVALIAVSPDANTNIISP